MFVSEKYSEGHNVRVSPLKSIILIIYIIARGGCQINRDYEMSIEMHIHYIQIYIYIHTQYYSMNHSMEMANGHGALMMTA